MFKVMEELSGSLIKSGKFRQAIPQFTTELRMALKNGVISEQEIFGSKGLLNRFSAILLNPSNFDEVQALGNSMLHLALRIPNAVPVVTKDVFDRNVKDSRGPN